MKTLTQMLIAEATEYEFKSAPEFKKARSWLKTVSAFANGVGGSIYFGVSDDGKVIGLSDIHTSAEQISELVKTKIDPTITFLLEPVTIEGKDILRLEIKTGQTTPYYYSADGNKIAYIRLGNESVQTPTHILNELILKGRHQSFDGLASKYSFHDYSFTLFEATYRQKTRHEIQRPNDYLSFGLIFEDEKLTYAGALLADQCPIMQSRVFCTRWNGLGKGSVFTDALDDGEFSGNAISLLSDALGFVRNNSKVKWRKTPGGRQEMPDYPQVAVHEAIVNAIIHRDYMIQGSEIHIDMYDDRMEIVSPGGMFDGKRIQDLHISEIASIRRNPILADVFHRLKFMERRGSGLKKIRDEYTSDLAPSFRSTEQVFIATLKNINYRPNAVQMEGVTDVTGRVTDHVTDVTGRASERGEKSEERMSKIIELIEIDQTISTAGIAEITGVSKRTVLRDIAELKKRGLLARRGTEKNGYWEVVSAVRERG